MSDPYRVFRPEVVKKAIKLPEEIIFVDDNDVPLPDFDVLVLDDVWMRLMLADRMLRWKQSLSVVLMRIVMKHCWRVLE